MHAPRARSRACMLLAVVCVLSAGTYACAKSAASRLQPSATPSHTALVASPTLTATVPAPAPSTLEPATPGEPAVAPTIELPYPPAPTPTAVPPPDPPPATSVLRDNQVIVYYGTPLAAGLGVLGTFEPEHAAGAVAEHARTYDALNGDLGALGALDVIYSIAQGEPTANGKYLRYLPDDYVSRYIALAEQHDLQIFLDLQIGRGDTLSEVKGIERFLLHPRVHVAVDPEYAVGPDGVPIATPGRISGDEINAIQDYLRTLIEANNLPAKMFVVHQYITDTITNGDRVTAVSDVDFVINMDAYGEVKAKKKKYAFFSAKPYSKHDAFNVFLVHDERVMSEQEILDLSPLPRVIFYQ